MLAEHLTTFAGGKVTDWKPGEALPPVVRIAAWGIWKESWVDRLLPFLSKNETWADRFRTFLDQPGSEGTRAIVVGSWANEITGTSETVVELLSVASERLPHLSGIFLGDVVSEECEISWIQQSDVSPILNAYPQLEYFGVRGGDGLQFGKLRHNYLRSLVVETGGLPSQVVRDVGWSELPALEHLELWLGEENYGGDTQIADLNDLLYRASFPRLVSLALRNSEISDGIAAALATSPLLAQLETLDLSLGTLGDAGVEALLASPHIHHLRKLDIHHHYVSPEMVDKLKGLGIEVDASEPEATPDWADPGQRFVAVGE